MPKALKFIVSSACAATWRGALMLSLLSGCSVYNSNFDCPPNKGLGCMSVSDVDSMINEGTIEEASSHKKSKSTCTKLTKECNCAKKNQNVQVTQEHSADQSHLPEKLKIYLGEHKEGGVIYKPSIVEVEL